MTFAIVMAVPAVMGAPPPQTVHVGELGIAEYNWVLHCQGCHGADARGTPGRVPRLTGNVARFLQSKAGRAFLGRVPGVAFVELSDSEVAELLNWVVWRFDAAHVPKTFTPYSATEVGVLRRQPLISGAYIERQKIQRSLPRAE